MCIFTNCIQQCEAAESHSYARNSLASGTFKGCTVRYVYLRIHKARFLPD